MSLTFGDRRDCLHSQHAREGRGTPTSHFMRMTIRDSLRARAADRSPPSRRTSSQPWDGGEDGEVDAYRFSHLDYGLVAYYDQWVFKRHRQGPLSDTAHGRHNETSPAPVKLAGIQVGPLAMEELSLRLQAAGNLALSAKLARAAAEGEIAVALSDKERGEILLALEECPAGLLRLRDVLRSQSDQTMPA